MNARNVKWKPPTPMLPASASCVGGVFSAVLPIRTKSEMNCRDHWRVVDKRKHEHYAITRAVLSGVQRWRLTRGPWLVTLTRVGPRRIDSDGATSGSKFLRDEIARWLGCDDGDDAMVTWEYAREIAPAYGVRVRITQRDDVPVQQRAVTRSAME